MQSPPKAGALHVFDTLFVLGTNADAVDATESKSADRRETFLNNSIFQI